MDDSCSTARTREKIVAATFDLMAAHNVRGLTLDRVAAQAKLSKGALLYHFKSKDELILAMLRHAVTGCVKGEQGNGVDNRPPGDASWRRLVWAVVAAACMSPLALTNNAHLFAALWDGCVDGEHGGGVPRKVLVNRIGIAFVEEFGLCGVPDREC